MQRDEKVMLGAATINLKGWLSGPEVLCNGQLRCRIAARTGIGWQPAMAELCASDLVIRVVAHRAGVLPCLGGRTVIAKLNIGGAGIL